MDRKFHLRRIVTITGVGVLLIFAELLAFRSLKHSADTFVRDMGTTIEKATEAADVVSSTFRLVPQGPVTEARISDLSKNPELFDGRLVRVRALLECGWETDDFLYDPFDPRTLSKRSYLLPRVWIYSQPGREFESSNEGNFGGSPVLGTFTGYFHFVPNQKSRANNMFDPGPYQLDVIGVSDLSRSN